MDRFKRITWLLGVGLILVALGANAVEWPQQIEASEGTIVVYQPQPERMTGNQLSGRAAMSLELNDKDEPIFGAFWFDARIDTDRDAGTALVRDINVTRVGWPDSGDADEARFTELVEAAIPTAGFTISLESLSASLKNAELEAQSLAELKNEAPTILFADELAVLLLYDGKPRFVEVENSAYERALNTPFVVVRHQKQGVYYLSSGNVWYSARSALGPWEVTSTPPADLVKLLPEPDDDTVPNAKPPAIVVATSPTELIATDGEPEWKSLAGGKLLYVENTETPWLRDVNAGQMYVLLSGRWFRAKEQKGPWAFVRADELPASFSEIPPASDIGGLRVSVAGTEEAEDALLDAQIPQTTAVKRSEASLEVTYDGPPTFEDIKGTKVAYAVNTGSQVLKIDSRYYAVDNGVWFVAQKPKGPWQVADSIPEDEIKQIPPSSPVYNTTYVEVYESTPEVVYVGYRPGYMWSFPYYGVPVYGTGWYYPPYWGGVYYPRPPTWGFHVGYNPWTGWNFGVSWSNGFFSFGASWGGGWHGGYRPGGCCGGWYGGGYHRPPMVINTGNINIGNTVNIGNRTHIKNSINKTNLRANQVQRNLYQRPQNRTRNASATDIKRNIKTAKYAEGRKNNVFTDKNGAVARKVGDDWQVRNQGDWHPDRSASEIRESLPQTLPQSRPEALPNRDNYQRPESFNRPSTLPAIDRNNLNRDFQARQRGMNRNMNRPMNRPMPHRR
ncbi:carbohydrate-binding protein [Gilvimarinus agarilyticus]|uniref:carbohydrate-binding protein n=1 Tax=Gilvimarinus agarilyticus TaxID=679259 RepID=UPI0005A28BB5|nr:carbohydrate-binding protein [Gilvimarinus agarilyticus]